MTIPIPCEYRRTVEIDAPVEQVFAFHADPRNIPKISPRWQSVRVLDASLAKTGEEFEIEVRFFGILPMRWRGVWREVHAPTLLVDEAVRSPFVRFEQRHEFMPLSAHRTRLTDYISYVFPGGALGRIFGETVGRLQFMLMFADRQARTRRWLHSHALSPSPAPPSH